MTIMKKLLKFSVLAWCLCASSWPVWAQRNEAANTDPRHLSVQQQPMVAWRPPAQASTLRPSVTLDHPDLLYRPGENAVASVRVNQDAYITMLNVDAQGVVTVLYPNDFARDNRVRANTTIQVGAESGGYRLAVSEPYGGNVLKVIASKQPIDWWAGRTSKRSGPFLALTDRGTDLARHLTVVATRTPQSEVASTEIVFGVVPQSYAVVQAAPPPPVPQGYDLPSPAPFVPSPPAPPEPTTNEAPYPIPTGYSDFGLQMSAGKPNYVSGEKIELVVTAERKCSLVLLDVAPDGSYNLLFPNAIDQEVWLTASKATFLSGTGSEGKVQASGLGPHTLVAMCSARRTFSQWAFGATTYRSGATGRTQIVAKQPSLAEVLSEQPKGDSARSTFVYNVSTN